MDTWKLQQEMNQLKDENQVLRSQLEVFERFYEHSNEMDEKWRYRYLFMTMAQGVIYQDATGAIVSANPSALNILGVTLHQILGATPSDKGWVAMDESGNTVPGHLHPSMSCLATGKRVGPVVLGIFNPIKEKTVWINVTSIPLFRKGETVPYQVYTSFEDFTQQKELSLQYQLLFNEMLDGFVLLERIDDAQGNFLDFRFISMNAAAEAFTGLTSNTTIGAPLATVIPDIEPIWRYYYKKVMDTGTPMKFRQYMSHFHKTFDVKAFTPEPGKVAVVFSDVSQLMEVENRLCEEKARAESANRAKSQFLANMNHELRTPLNGLMGMHQLLKLTALDEEQNSFVDDAISCCKAMNHIVDEIITYSKLDKEPEELIETPFTPASLLKEIIRLHKPAAKAKGLALSHYVEKELPYYLQGDRFKIKQVLMLLVSNAIKFTHQGTVTLSLSVSRMLEGGQTEVMFSVHDTGIGIPQEHLDNIFEHFIQADSSHTRKYGGLGLGLSTAKKLAQKLNGHLSVESVDGMGSCFSFTCTLRSSDIEATG